jgi:Ion transport protein
LESGIFTSDATFKDINTKSLDNDKKQEEKKIGLKKVSSLKLPLVKNHSKRSINNHQHISHYATQSHSLLDNSTRQARINSARVKVKKVVHKLAVIRKFNESFDASYSTSSSNNLLSNKKASTNDSNINGNSLFPVTSMKKLEHSNSSKVLIPSRKNRKLSKIMDAYVKEQSNLYEYGNQRRLIGEVEDSLPWYLIQQTSLKKTWWDLLILVLVLYAAITVPFSIGFDVVAKGSLAIFEFAGDCIFIMDLILSFFVTFTKNGILVTSLKDIFYSYVTGWFILDLFATFPVDWITEGGPFSVETNTISSISNTTVISFATSKKVSVGSLNKLLRLIRLFKLFRLLRLFKLFPKLFSMLENSISIDPAILRFFRSFIALAALWHYFACAYWFVVRTEYGGTSVCPSDPTITCFINRCV